MTTDLTPEVLAELRQLDGLAAPGPWTHDGFCRIDSAPLSGGGQMSIYDEGGHDENDASLIALMRNHLPALLDAAEREAAARKRVEWQPIETAPLNKGVLIADNSENEPVSAYKDGDHWWDNGRGSMLPFDPLYWKPLPDPPALSTSTEQEKG